MTLNDLELRNGCYPALFHRIRVRLGANYVIVVEVACDENVARKIYTFRQCMTVIF